MTLRFNSDGTFRVLQMADIQDGPNVREDTIRLIEAAIKKTHPDLIVFTGDQIRGYDPAYIDTFLRRRGEQPGTHIRAVTEIEAKIRGIKRHPFTKALLEQPPTDDNWMIDGIGTDSPKLVKRNKRDGRNGSEERIMYRDVIPDGDIDLHNLSVGDNIKRQFNCTVNNPPKLASLLGTGR